MEQVQAPGANPVPTATATPANAQPGRGRRPRRKHVVLSAIAVLALVVTAGLAWFQPYKLLIDNTVNDPDPGADDVLIAQGSFVSHEHATSGSVRLLKRGDGTQLLRIDELDTSNGPVLKVWLSDSPVQPGKDGWYVFANGRHVDLGRLKGNKGSQNYVVPTGVDLTGLGSVTIWCDRFHVSFGAASLNAAG